MSKRDNVTGSSGDPYENFPSEPANFSADKVAATLNTLFATATAHTRARMAWYDARSASVAQRARLLRRLALWFFIAGTMAPLVGTVLMRMQMDGFKVADVPLGEAGYLVLAMAAGFVLYDQFFGLSHSWMRFRQAQARLSVLLAELRFDWARQLASAGGSVNQPEVAQALIALLDSHVRRVEVLAETETLEWAQRFRLQIEGFDRSLRSAEAGRGAGADRGGGAAHAKVKPGRAR